jgi:hypothetical protein
MVRRHHIIFVADPPHHPTLMSLLDVARFMLAADFSAALFPVTGASLIGGWWWRI